MPRKKVKAHADYKTVLVLTDIHVPEHDELTLEPVLKFIGDEWWDYVLDLGDLMDFNSISFFNHGKPRLVGDDSLDHDYDVANQILDARDAAVLKNNPDAIRVQLQGNHEHRVERLLDEQPQLGEVTIGVEHNLRLEERGIEWVKSWNDGTTYKIGKAHFHHGLYTNLHHAKKMVEEFGCNIFYGHTHDIQTYSKVFQGRDKTLQGSSLGCLCKYEQRYMRGRPNKWQQAIAVFHIFPDGFFQKNVIPIFKHRFVSPTTGKVYQKKLR